MDEWNVTPNMRTLEKLDMTPNTKMINQELNGLNVAPNTKMMNLEMNDLSMLMKDSGKKEDDDQWRMLGRDIEREYYT